VFQEDINRAKKLASKYFFQTVNGLLSWQDGYCMNFEVFGSVVPEIVAF
jgi:hypothetical protein